MMVVLGVGAVLAGSAWWFIHREWEGHATLARHPDTVVVVTSAREPYRELTEADRQVWQHECVRWQEIASRYEAALHAIVKVRPRSCADVRGAAMRQWRKRSWTATESARPVVLTAQWDEEPAMICDECLCEIDESQPGHGHRLDLPCGHYTFTVNPDVIDFLKEQPKDATPRELTMAWFKHLGVVPPEPQR